MYADYIISASKFNFTHDDRGPITNKSVPTRHVESDGGKERSKFISPAMPKTDNTPPDWRPANP